jgi:hypothetical protein
MHRPNQPLLLELVAEAIRARRDHDRWQVTARGPWCSVARIDRSLREQGWKLHVAATPSSAEAVLEGSLPVLLDAGCAFKLAATLEDVLHLNGPHYPREGAGKFLTVYPSDDDELRALAARLDAATVGLAAPSILSDRAYRPGSAVHYRYGAFNGRVLLGNDGELVPAIEAPDGTLVPDRREPRFTPPAWAPAPFAADPVRSRPRAVLLGDRYEVAEALRHANKGGVYRATDRATGATVVVKEARPHVAGDLAGRDARDVLRGEAAMLELLSTHALAPRLLSLFEQGGHLFLVQEFVHGVTLRHFALAHGDPDRALALAERLADALAAAHELGVVVRDFNPNNVIVTPGDGVRMIDLELAVVADASEADDAGRRRGTAAYAAAEQLAGAPPAVSADAFSLGATLAYLFTGTDPHFVADDGDAARTTGARLAEWLAAGPPAERIGGELGRLVLALCDDVPERRPSADRARRRLAALRTSGRGPAGTPQPEAIDDERLAAALDGVLEHLLTTFDPAGERAWPSTAFGRATDPCNVQHGAGGVVGALLAAWRRTGDERVAATVSDACRWMERALERGPERRIPGLYFGLAGTAWALADAGHELGRPQLVERALSLATGLDHRWPSPDVTHGRAGLGLALLRLWKLTGEHEALARAGQVADSLLEDELPGPGWEAPRGFASHLAGQRFHGFAHGTAGIATFLLELGRGETIDAARRAGDALLAAAIPVGDGLAWASGPAGDQQPLPHWCNGSSGVGTFLLRLHAVTGDARFRAAAEAAGRHVVDTRWHGGIAYCHGLPGEGDFLLELGDRAGAERLAAVLWHRRVLRDGRVVFADPDGAVAADFNVGLGGVLAFLLRLRHPEPRPWLP